MTMNEQNCTQPLKGIRVLDTTRALAGPYAAMILGDFGAEITKIEWAPDGDIIRKWGHVVKGESTFALSTNRNKRSLLIDGRTTTGLDVIRRMASHADVFLENFRPGVADQLGLGYESLRKTNERLVYGSISGFGRMGPRASEPGFDIESHRGSRRLFG